MKIRGSKKNKQKEIAVNKEIPATTAPPGRVDTIIKALSTLESDIDSQNEKLADMKKQLNQRAQREIDQLHEKVTQMATKEAEVMIAEARDKAKSESQRIMTAGDLNLKDVQNKIDAKFNEAVDHVVSTVLKA
jgi:V/A-type H+/Na+-transporting ATPase subunit G/H